MTFTLPRLHRPNQASSTHLQPAPVQAAPVAPTSVTDVYIEVVLPARQALPRVPGWQLRLWPTASLGDATLQAHPDGPQVSVASLTDALHAQGIQTLGLTRRR
ncbi:hypothetical protein [Deinococcus sp.]|uniref:hypothetical protein n=1 Tax=Deinococcus sp. TaxID=47478 RepID=UPI0025F0D7A6|nr:hypothetical protein [Deinococcus sp.]